MSDLVIFTEKSATLFKFYLEVFNGRDTSKEDGHASMTLEDGQLTFVSIGQGDCESDTEVLNSPRSDCAFKPSFAVKSIEEAVTRARNLGGTETGRNLEFAGSAYCDIVDPEGNVIQLRQRID